MSQNGSACLWACTALITPQLISWWLQVMALGCGWGWPTHCSSIFRSPNSEVCLEIWEDRAPGLCWEMLGMLVAFSSFFFTFSLLVVCMGLCVCLGTG